MSRVCLGNTVKTTHCEWMKPFRRTLRLFRAFLSTPISDSSAPRCSRRDVKVSEFVLKFRWWVRISPSFLPIPTIFQICSSTQCSSSVHATERFPIASRCCLLRGHFINSSGSSPGGTSKCASAPAPRAKSAAARAARSSLWSEGTPPNRASSHAARAKSAAARTTRSLSVSGRLNNLRSRLTIREALAFDSTHRLIGRKERRSSREQARGILSQTGQPLAKPDLRSTARG